MSESKFSLDIGCLKSLYAQGALTPEALVEDILNRCEAINDKHIWIHPLSREELEPYLARLKNVPAESLPLYGVPFAIKDNIDLAGIPTTAGCPDFTYIPKQSATVVQLLIDAGAIPIGKTNMDQFATGLVGTRSPYGACDNSFDKRYISGGSSSGSAVAVARGLVSFSLGTDTAGSGRVPAAFNNIWGVKPSRGLLSVQGVVPACLSLDCVSIFALCPSDAEQVLSVAAQPDATDAYSRKLESVQSFTIKGKQAVSFGVIPPEQREFFGNNETPALYEQAIERMIAAGAEAIEINFEPFKEAAQLLYEGPWVTERYVAVGEFMRKHPDSALPVTRSIIEKGRDYHAVDVFEAFYRLEALRKKAYAEMGLIDFILMPTAGTVYEKSAVDADPVQLNTNLGYYTNFMNLLDLSGLAVPAGFQENGLPFGVTLVAPVHSDFELIRMGALLSKETSSTMGATGIALPKYEAQTSETDYTTLAVCGAHMEGLPLNPQLQELSATFLERTETDACYRFYALIDKDPIRPGLVRDEAGANIEVELWQIPTENLGKFLNKIASPLGLGSVQLKDGRVVLGFICEAFGVAYAEEITHLGSWRKYIE